VLFRSGDRRSTSRGSSPGDSLARTDRTSSSSARRSPGEDPRDVERRSPVGRRAAHSGRVTERGEGRPRARPGHEAEEDELAGFGDLREPGDGGQIDSLRAGRGASHRCLRDTGGGQEARVSRIRSPRARRGGHHGGAEQAGHDTKADQRPPPGADLGPSSDPCRLHVTVPACQSRRGRLLRQWGVPVDRRWCQHQAVSGPASTRRPRSRWSGDTSGAGPGATSDTTRDRRPLGRRPRRRSRPGNTGRWPWPPTSGRSSAR